MSEKKKSQKSDLSHAATVLHSLLQSRKSPLSEQFIRWKLWNAWPDVVGPEMAKNSMPVSYLEGILYVWVSSAPRLQEMTFLIRPLKEKINKFAGKKNWVKAIRFTLDRKSVPLPQENAEDLRGFLSKPLPNEGEEPPPDR